MEEKKGLARFKEEFDESLHDLKDDLEWVSKRQVEQINDYFEENGGFLKGSLKAIGQVVDDIFPVTVEGQVYTDPETGEERYVEMVYGSPPLLIPENNTTRSLDVRKTVNNQAANKAAGKGGLTIVEGGTYSASERLAAETLSGQGRNVVLRPPVGTRAAGGTSDLLVDGVRYDVYTPTTTNASRIISAIAKKNTQAEGIVLDLSQTSVTRPQLGDILKRVNGAGATNIQDIQIIGGN